MRVIIAGSRSIEPTRRQIAFCVHTAGYSMTEVVCGMARGVDLCGKEWADNQRPTIPVAEFPANWVLHGRHAAGRIRNSAMGDYADALIAIWDGISDGTVNMVHIMAGMDKPFCLFIPDGDKMELVTRDAYKVLVHR